MASGDLTTEQVQEQVTRMFGIEGKCMARCPVHVDLREIEIHGQTFVFCSHHYEEVALQVATHEQSNADENPDRAEDPQRLARVGPR